MKKFLVKFAPIASIMAFFGFIASKALAVDYTTETVASAMGGTLDVSVQGIIATIISFLTNNLPLIVILGVSVGLVFWLIRKAVHAIHGKV